MTSLKRGSMKVLKWQVIYKMHYVLKAQYMRDTQARYFDYGSLYTPQGLAIAQWLEDKFKKEGAE